jgi:hypothetical protein
MAGEILDKLTTLLGGRTDDGMFGTKPIFEEEMFDKMFHFIVSLDPDQLSEEQSSDIMEMIEDIEIEYEGVNEDGSMDEAPKRVKRDRGAARKRAKSYRKNKSQRKRAAKKYRKSARGKQMAKKSARMAKRGKTATGKRIRQYR